MRIAIRLSDANVEMYTRIKYFLIRYYISGDSRIVGKIYAKS